MKLLPNNVYLRKLFFVGAKKTEVVESSSANELMQQIPEGIDILAQENRAILLEKVPNFVPSLKTDFKSTKEMFQYAKERCMEGIKQGYEHTVFMDTKKNKIICELKGDADKCDIGIIKYLNIDPKNITLMHGHPEDYPLSSTDVQVLYDYGIDKVIAINERGEFSLMTHKHKPQVEHSHSRLKDLYIQRRDAKRRKNNFYNFLIVTNDNIHLQNDTLINYKQLLETNLKYYAPQMDMRYMSNYTFN